MSESVVAFIGLGLIGGSIAKSIKRIRPQTKIMAYMRTLETLEQAKADGAIDVILEGIDSRLLECDYIFLCTPVEFNVSYLTAIKPYLNSHCILTDVGSTKANIHEVAENLGLEANFIGGHPMAGSEKTGYENSTDHLLENAYYVITAASKSKQEDIDKITRLVTAIGALPIHLDYKEHDYVVGAISHLPHIIASSLVNFVQSSDSQQEIMKRVAAGGFKDITRIASASPIMWQQICVTNHQNIAQILPRYINSLEHILEDIKHQDEQAIYQLFEQAKDYRNSISDQSRGPIKQEYSFCLDILDEPGAISTIAVILSAKSISIKNIGIIHSREYDDGVLKIVFYEEAPMEKAWELLKKHGYLLYKR